MGSDPSTAKEPSAEEVVLRVIRNTGSWVKRLLGFALRYFGWLFLAFLSTVGGVFLVALFADWSLERLLASGLAWPVLGCWHL